MRQGCPTLRMHLHTGRTRLTFLKNDIIIRYQNDINKGYKYVSH